MNYQTRTLRLIDDKVRNLALAAVQNAPAGIEVVLREPVKVRGLDQNGYYFMRIGEIAEQGWHLGKQYSKDVWHEYAKKYLMPELVTTKDGVVVSKWIETPDGGMTVISTTRLERGCFADYTTAVEAFGSSLGVMFSAKPDERKTA